MDDNSVDVELIQIKEMSDKEIAKFLNKNAMALTVEEAKLIAKKLGRNPTLTELHAFNIEWSEHCSYKSSKELLKMLPTTGPTVMQGPEEDAGIIKFTEFNGENYGIVIGHESHNHPSQVVPYEGAATGIGGILRDVLCMGAKVIASADPLRFGSLEGKNKDRTKYIAQSVFDGIAGYGNPVGLPNIAGDVYFNDSFDDNCLVNVVCLGLIKENEIIHSHVPKNGDNYDIILIGKATDNSGFGGAAFASVVLNEEDNDTNKGAVQVPDPFLKNVIIRATYKVFQESRNKGIEIGFKDLGAGGVMCCTSELGSVEDYGMDIDLDKVHVSMKNLPPYVIACSETQERFAFIVPTDFTEDVLRIYNEEFELPRVSEGARASVIGKVTRAGRFVMRHEGKIVCNAPIKEVTAGIRYQREKKKAEKNLEEPNIPTLSNYSETVLDVLSHPNVASRRNIFEHYDTDVQGNTIIKSGDADAGLIAPIPGCSAGVALSVDSNPKYSRISSFYGGVNAVAEAMRNVAAIGATPYGMTDCLNFGNPEIPEQFYELYDGVKGISEAAKNLYVKGTTNPVPFVSGNVSLYNESNKKSVAPSAVIACVGVMNDISRAITMKIKKQDTVLCLIGPRKDELGGSVYYELHGKLGKNIPKIDYEIERGMIYGVLDAIDKRLLLSCHDISDGGVITTVSEMVLGGKGDGQVGAVLQFNDTIKSDKLLFSESSGFVMEIDQNSLRKVEEIFKKYNVDVFKIGETGGSALIVNHDEKEAVHLDISQLRDAWLNGLSEELQ